METKEKINVTVESTVNAPVERVWNIWTEPKHVLNWNNASPDWHTPRAENDLRVGGSFLSRMEARDGSAGFDFEGTYTKVETNRVIEYVMPDDRRVRIVFNPKGKQTVVTESFDAETENSVEMQKGGWQSILDNFKNYVEGLHKIENIHFEIHINAPVEKVYKTMLDKEHYREWTKEFNPTSYFKGNWEQGSKMLFIGTDKDGTVGGMVSRIKENNPNKQLVIEHLGILKGEEEIISGPDVEGWAGAMESYTFRKDNNKTKLLVDMDSNAEFKSYFEETWPKALNRLKSICEK